MVLGTTTVERFVLILSWTKFAYEEWVMSTTVHESLLATCAHDKIDSCHMFICSSNCDGQHEPNGYRLFSEGDLLHVIDAWK